MKLIFIVCLTVSLFGCQSISSKNRVPANEESCQGSEKACPCQLEYFGPKLCGPLLLAVPSDCSLSKKVSEYNSLMDSHGPGHPDAAVLKTDINQLRKKRNIELRDGAKYSGKCE